MTVLSRTKKPFSPTKRLSSLFNALRSPIRSRVPGRSQPTSAHQPHALSAAALALANEDLSADAVVITTLPHVPFKDHASLLAMGHSSLRRTAEAFNERLPAALKIDDERGRTYIRNSIETLVGLRPPSPRKTRPDATPVSHPKTDKLASNASKHARTKSLDVSVTSKLTSLPQTPQRNSRPQRGHSRTESYGLYAAVPGGGGILLEVLQEASEEDVESVHARPAKKRCMACPPTTLSTDRSPTPMPRSQHRRTASECHTSTTHAERPVPIYPPACRPPLRRAASDQTPRRVEVEGMDFAFLHPTNGLRLQPKEKIGKASTPKRLVLATLKNRLANEEGSSARGKSKRKAVEMLEECDITFELNSMTISAIKSSNSDATI